MYNTYVNLKIYITSQLANDLKETFNRIWSAAREKDENVFKKQDIKPEDLYFFLCDSETKQVVSVGRLRYITGITIGEIPWDKPIWGLASVSTDPKHQGQGYGKKLINEIVEYAKNKGLWIVGFHGKATGLSDFYKKCGLEVDEKIGEKIIFPKNGEHKTHVDSSVSYLKGDPFVAIAQKSDNKIELPYSW